jgi:hypothetical protein
MGFLAWSGRGATLPRDRRRFDRSATKQSASERCALVASAVQIQFELGAIRLGAQGNLL